MLIVALATINTDDYPSVVPANAGADTARPRAGKPAVDASCYHAAGGYGSPRMRPQARPRGDDDGDRHAGQKKGLPLAQEPGSGDAGMARSKFGMRSREERVAPVVAESHVLQARPPCPAISRPSLWRSALTRRPTATSTNRSLRRRSRRITSWQRVRQDIGSRCLAPSLQAQILRYKSPGTSFKLQILSHKRPG